MSTSSVAIDVEVIIASVAGGGSSTGCAGCAVGWAILSARSVAKSVERVAGCTGGCAVSGTGVAVWYIADKASSIAHRSWVEWRLTSCAGIVGVAGGARRKAERARSTA